MLKSQLFFLLDRFQLLKKNKTSMRVSRNHIVSGIEANKNFGKLSRLSDGNMSTFKLLQKNTIYSDVSYENSKFSRNFNWRDIPKSLVATMSLTEQLNLKMNRTYQVKSFLKEAASSLKSNNWIDLMHTYAQRGMAVNAAQVSRGAKQSPLVDLNQAERDSLDKILRDTKRAERTSVNAPFMYRAGFANQQLNGDLASSAVCYMAFYYYAPTDINGNNYVIVGGSKMLDDRHNKLGDALMFPTGSSSHDLLVPCQGISFKLGLSDSMRRIEDAGSGAYFINSGVLVVSDIRYINSYLDYFSTNVLNYSFDRPVAVIYHNE